MMEAGCNDGSWIQCWELDTMMGAGYNDGSWIQ